MRHDVSAPTTLADCLRVLFPDSSGRTRKQILAHGRVEVNGTVVRDPRAPLVSRDVVEVAARGAPPPPSIPGLHIVHEDDDLLVVEKAAGLLTIATKNERERTAYALLHAYVKDADPRAKVFIVHRLDRVASGLLVFAKTPQMKQALQEQFKAHAPERAYIAAVDGRPAGDEGVIKSRLLEDASGRVHEVHAHDARARDAVTHWRVLREGQGVTLIEVRLETGRKHQIRVHLAGLGHPIVGDEVYGRRGKGPIGRLALHAATLGFVHPRSGERIHFESKPPREIERLARGATGAAPRAPWTPPAVALGSVPGKAPGTAPPRPDRSVLGKVPRPAARAPKKR